MPAATTTAIRQQVRDFVDDVINAHDPDAADRYLSDDVRLGTVPPRFHRGLAGAKDWYRYLFAAIPDLHAEIDDLIADGDKFAVRWTMRGTHRGEFMGVQPTNRQVEINLCAIGRVHDGKLAAIDGAVDKLEMLQQMGVVEPPAQR